MEMAVTFCGYLFSSSIFEVKFVDCMELSYSYATKYTVIV